MKIKHLDRYQTPKQDEISTSNLDGGSRWSVMGFDYQTGPRFGQQLADHRCVIGERSKAA